MTPTRRGAPAASRSSSWALSISGSALESVSPHDVALPISRGRGLFGGRFDDAGAGRDIPAGSRKPRRRPDRRRVRSSRNDAARSMPASARPAAAAASTADGFAARPSRGAHHDNGRIDPTGLTPALGTSGRSSRLVFGNRRRHFELVTARAALENVRHRVTARGRLPHRRARPTTQYSASQPFLACIGVFLQPALSGCPGCTRLGRR